jgi:hypothetical protein
MMGMIPVGPSLFCNCKLVKEGMPRGDWALIYPDDTIVVVCAVLKKTMPMLDPFDMMSEN